MKKSIWFLILLLSCAAEELPTQRVDYWADFIPSHPEYDILSLKANTKFSGTKVAIDTVPVDEISGMVASKKYPGLAWMHNDSGNETELILIRLSDGKIVCRYTDTDIQHVDWEDIGSYRDKAGRYWLVIGDIGDNLEQRNHVTLYYLEEPNYHDGLEGTKQVVNFNEQTRHVVYPDGACDSEALFVDPDRGDTYIITKRSARSRIYGLPYKENYAGWDTAILCGSFPFNSITAADVQGNPRKLVLRTYLDILVWEWEFGSDIRQVMAEVPEKLPYDQSEPQGEAIAWSEDGQAYYVISEKLFGIPAILYRWE